MIKSLTALRGIFILFIFFHHAGVYPGGGSMAVVFFFVLSGFSMTLGYKDRINQPSFNYKQYLIKRCVKFFPLHWITLVADIPYVLMSTVHWWLIPLFFVNASLCQTIVPIQEVYFSYNAVSWFLADILFFAIVFPFVCRKIAAMSNKQRGIMMAVSTVLYIVVVSFAFQQSEGIMKGIIYISPFVRLFDFVLGILLALYYINLKEKTAGSSFLILGGGNFNSFDFFNNATDSGILHVERKNYTYSTTILAFNRGSDYDGSITKDGRFENIREQSFDAFGRMQLYNFFVTSISSKVYK